MICDLIPKPCASKATPGQFIKSKQLKVHLEGAPCIESPEISELHRWQTNDVIIWCSMTYIFWKISETPGKIDEH